MACKFSELNTTALIEGTRGHVGTLARGDRLRGQGDMGTRGDAKIHGQVGSRATT